MLRNTKTSRLRRVLNGEEKFCSIRQEQRPVVKPILVDITGFYLFI